MTDGIVVHSAESCMLHGIRVHSVRRACEYELFSVSIFALSLTVNCSGVSATFCLLAGPKASSRVPEQGKPDE